MGSHVGFLKNLKTLAIINNTMPNMGMVNSVITRIKNAVPIMHEANDNMSVAFFLLWLKALNASR